MCLLIPFLPMFTPYLQTLISVAAVGAVSLIGIALFLISESVIRKFLLILVSFSVGALLGDVFYHILPELAEGADFERALTLVLAGMILSFVVEKMIHWHHCHVLPAEESCCEHHHVGTMSLIGDGVHNFIDGALIAASFLVSAEIGIATTIAVLLHEIPQEIGDFAVLLHSGYTRKKALLFNLLSALMAFIGAGIVLVMPSASAIADVLLPIAAGNFLYLAGSDLIPELHKETRFRRAVLQLVAILAGIAVMFSLTLVEPDHTDSAGLNFSGTVVTMSRPASDIDYDYALVLDAPYADPLNAFGEELTQQFPLVQVNQDLDFSHYVRSHVYVVGTVEWGYAESRVLHVQSMRE